MSDRLLGKVPAEGPGAPGGVESQGRLIGRRYKLLSPVGRGGMGMVWHAHDVLLDRPVAVKELILPYGLDHAGTQVAHRRMMREARSAARLGHPGIVTVHDVVEEDGRPWIVMELVRAWSLEQAVRQSGPLPVIQAAEIGVRVLDALRHAHAAGILHRDVKPGNVLLTADRVVLTDFGIAAIEGDVTITQTGLLMGSPAYIPPERLSGQPITQAADLWSFGATLYAAVEGRPPYEGPDAIAVLGAVLTQEPIKPQRAGALLPVIEGLLRKNPAERMNAGQVAELMERVLRSHGSTSARSAGPIPTPADSTPMHLLPPLDPPSGPLPSRIVETPSGPVRVPYDPLNSPSGGHAMPYEGVESPSGAHRTDLLPAPGGDAFGSSSGGFPTGPPQSASGEPTGPAGAQRYDALRSPSDPRGHRIPSGYDALRSPSGAHGAVPPVTSGPPSLEGAAFPAHGSTGNAMTPGPQPQPILPLTDSARTGPSALASRPPASGEAIRATHDREDRAARGRRRTGGDGGWINDGRPTPRLVVTAVAAVGVLTAAILIATSGGPSTGPDVAASTAASTAPVPVPLAAVTVPEGFKEHAPEGFTAAVPSAWKLTSSGDKAVFDGPKDSGLKITVEPATPQNDGGLAELTGREAEGGVDGYIRVQLQEVKYQGWKAADWEYQYTESNGVPMQALTRHVTPPGQDAFTITFIAPQLQWDDQAKTREVFLSTFRPAS
ncbi:serine/threonine-protein kinase [Nonomuraea africana]|uniref:non-specific serine/threonine protein kinase n=1 Tax=Nonomuraea africana TaxID=46171 RepID=A0ABR9K8R7_9ACTN|nr:serine/threonine-protein kinase [Nonomuraea africana]MBE1558406.1 serine/threonine protein kinase [Nonomuraea africana]